MVSWLSGVLEHLGDEMAKGRASASAVHNEECVAYYAGLLDSAGTDRSKFESVKAAIEADKRLRALDVQLIAQRYNDGGKKPPSRAAALATISKRFVEIVRYHAKNEIAAKARPW